MFFLGLDLGKLRDYTALVIIEKVGFGRTAELHTRYLSRWKLGTPYPEIVDDVVKLLQRDELAKQPCTLGIDGTGVGVAVTDLFRQQPIKAEMRFISITGGDTVNAEGDTIRVPKKELVASVQIALQTARLKIASSLPNAKVLERELKDFEVKITDTGHATFGAWREGAHDDLVLALAIASWLARTRENFSWINFYGAGAKNNKIENTLHTVSTNGGKSTLFPIVRPR